MKKNNEEKKRVDLPVPENYFEELEDRIISRIREDDAQVRNPGAKIIEFFLKPGTIGLAVAASFALFAMVYFNPFEREYNLEKSLASLEVEEIEEYIELQMFSPFDLAEELQLASLEDDFNLDFLNSDEITEELENIDDLELILEL